MSIQDELIGMMVEIGKEAVESGTVSFEDAVEAGLYHVLPQHAGYFAWQIKAEISKLLCEDWHDDDRARQANIDGLRTALRIVEGGTL